MANLSNINNKFLVTTGGNVLIGATADVATVRLHVKNASAAAVLRLTGGSDSWDFDTYYTDNKLFIKSNGAAGTVMTLLGASGNVGIGTTSPAVELHVKAAGTPTIAQSSSSTLTAGSRGDLAWYNSNISTVANIRALADTDNVGTSLQFFTRPAGGSLTQKMVIKGGGYVGIGTDSPDRLLDVSGTGNVYAKIQSTNSTAAGIELDTNGGSIENWLIQADEGIDGLAVYDLGRTAYRMVIDSVGDVQARRPRSNTAGEVALSLQPSDTTAHYGWRIDQTNNSLNLDYVNTPLNIMSYTYTGNVGIGTATPTSPASVGTFLDITGRSGVSGGTAGIVLKDYDNDAWDIWTSGGTLNARYNNSGTVDGFGISSSGDTVFYTSTNQGGLAASSATDNTTVRIINTSTGGQAWRLQSTGGTSGLGQGKLFIKVAGTETAANLISFDAPSGANIKMGIGTTGPTTKLHLGGTAPLDSIIRQDSTVSGTNWEIGERAAGKWQIWQDDGDTVVTTFMSTGNVGIGTESPGARIDIKGVAGSPATSGTTQNGILRIQNATNNNTLDIGQVAGSPYGTWLQAADKTSLGTSNVYPLILNPMGGNIGIGTDSPNEKLQVTGKTIIGTSSTYTSNAGSLSVNHTSGFNGGIVDTHSNGGARYYTRVAHANTGSSSAGYWHIKTNILTSNSIMFLAKFYGYVYGQAAVVDLQHAGYAYSGGSVINQGVQNNGNVSGMSSAIYLTAANEVCFRIDLVGSTYYAGLWMDIGFQNPTGGNINFKVEAQVWSATTNYYT